MGYYKVKSMSVQGGTVYMTIANSRVSPQYWFRDYLHFSEEKSTYEQLLFVGRELYDGGYQFLKSSKCKAKRIYDQCKKRHGTFRDHYDNGDCKKYRERFASEFARKMCA